MKKIFAILLAVTMLASMATVVSAAENTTTLTTTVPAATYTLNIPANQEIEYGATKTDIGNVTITGSENFAEGKNIEVSITFTEFTSESVSTVIPFTLGAYYQTKANGLQGQGIKSGNKLVFFGNKDMTVNEKATTTYEYKENGIDRTEKVDVEMLKVNISSSDWGKALAGEYTATITFTAEVVAG